jgi:hypothetical protein
VKILKLGIRFWITITSILSFVGGWIMLAHAPKPSQVNATIASSLPTLEPLPPLSGSSPNADNVQNRPLFSIQPRTRLGFNPFFTTGGS